MAVKKPIKSTIIGPEQSLDEKASVLLSTINHDILRTNPIYCKRTIDDVEWMYSKNKKEVPIKIKERIYRLRKMIEG